MIVRRWPDKLSSEEGTQALTHLEDWLGSSWLNRSGSSFQELWKDPSYESSIELFIIGHALEVLT